MKKIIIIFVLSLISIYSFSQQKITITIGNKKDSALVYLPDGYKTSQAYPLLIYSVGVKDTSDLYIPFFLKDKKIIRVIPFAGDAYLNSKKIRALNSFMMNEFPVDTMNITVLQQ